MKKMKNVIVDKEKCIGCGACIAIDPAHFDFSDEGYSEVISNNNLNTDELKNAMDSCPTNAIYGSDKDCKCDESCDCGCQNGEPCTCDNNCECDEECNCEGCDCCKHE